VIVAIRLDPDGVAPRRRTVRGFTLIELMITLAIVAILSSLAAPSFRELVATQRVRSAVSALNESLWLARSEAIKRNAAVEFAFANVGNGWSVTAGATTLHTQDPFPGVGSGSGDFAFNAYGRLTRRDGLPLEIGVASAEIYRCVTVSSTGRSEVKDGKC